MPSRPPKPGGRYAIQDKHKIKLTDPPEFETKRIGQLLSISGTKPTGKVFLLTFDCFGKRVGELELKDKKLHFKGDADKSAKLLFDQFKQLVEQFIEQRLTLGPRSHKVTFTQDQLAAALPDSYFSISFSETQTRTRDLLFKWFHQAEKPGDKFTVEIVENLTISKGKEICQNTK